MMDFKRTIERFIRRQSLLQRQENIIIAVSGGVDSMVLLDVLWRLKQDSSLNTEFIVAHVNHQLRGPAADADEAFVIDAAGKYNQG